MGRPRCAASRRCRWAAGVAAASFLVGCGGDPAGGELVVTQAVPADVRAEIDETWERYRHRFAARLACVPDATLFLVRDVEGGDARYLAEEARIEIEIPTTPARFRESLAHELAHHIDHTCPAFAELRAALQRRLGGDDRPWATGDVWTEIPAETWAEAFVEATLGERIRHAEELPIGDDVTALVRAWAAGEPVS